MITRIFTIFALLGLLCASSFAGAVKDGSFSARSDGSGILVRWMSEDESGVARFELEREVGLGGQFYMTTQFGCKGNNSVYEFLDETAFRPSEGVYKYRIKVIFSNGSQPAIYGPITVAPKTSGFRRTWGSIKAMFR